MSSKVVALVVLTLALAGCSGGASDAVRLSVSCLHPTGMLLNALKDR